MHIPNDVCEKFHTSNQHLLYSMYIDKQSIYYSPWGHYRSARRLKSVKQEVRNMTLKTLLNISTRHFLSEHALITICASIQNY